MDRRTRSRKIRIEDARRPRVILLLADGASFTTIANCRRVLHDPYPAMESSLRGPPRRAARQVSGQSPTVRTSALEARVAAKTRRPPTDGGTHRTTQKLAKELGISHILVARVAPRRPPATLP